MTNNFFLQLIKLRQTAYFISLAILFIFTLSFTATAQPDFSKDDLQILKERKMSPDAFKHQVSQEKFPMPEINISDRSISADGNLDPAFNASVTEGFGYVNKTVIQPDGKIIIAGLFQRVNGTRVNGISRLNADGSLDTSFNSGTGANAAVRTVTLQTDGKIIVGGAFTSFNGQAVNRIVRLNADGSIDPSFGFTVAFNNQINDIAALSDGKILVGGQFNSPPSRLVRLNANGTFDASATITGTVFKIALQNDGKILVAGLFSNRITRLNADLTFDFSFNIGSGIGGAVLSIVIQPNGKILLGGTFPAYNGTTTDEIVRINSDGSVDTVFEFLTDNQISNAEVDALALQPDGKILATYYYYDDNNGYTSYVARFNANATLDGTFTTGNLDQSFADSLTVLGNGSFLVGGTFVSYNNQTRLHLAKLNQDGTFDNTFNSSVSTTGIVYAVKHQPDGKIVIGGDFDFVNGVRKTGIVRLNPDGTLDNTFTLGSGFFGDIYDFEIQPDGKFVIGGLFSGNTNFPGATAVRINSNGSFDVDLNSNELKIATISYAVALQADNKILIGGQIFDETSIGNVAANRLNPNGTFDTSFTPTNIPNGFVRSLMVQPGGKILVGGTFFAQGNFQRTGLARLNSNGALDSSFSGNCPNTYVLEQLPDGRFYAGGFFLNGCGGSPSPSYLARMSVDGINDSGFVTAGRANNGVRAIEIQPDGKVLTGGLFTTYDGVTASHIARVKTDGSIDSTFNSGTGASGNVYALNLQSDGKILAGGVFLDFNGTEKLSIVRIQNSAIRRPTPFDFDGDSKTDLSIFRPNGGEWWYSRSSDGQVRAAQFGAGTDKIVPADFSGDGKTDIAVWRPSTGEWFILRSEDGSFFSVPFGTVGDIAAPADYDGDGKADVAVFRPSTGTWFISRSSGGTDFINFGQPGDVPVAADYDGDGKADTAIFRPSNGQWWLNRSTAGVVAAAFGTSTDRPVQGDYSGDGKTDIAFYRPSSGEWFVLRSEDASFYSVPFGAVGDTPTPGDYDGDGKFDTAIFRPNGSTWYVNRSTAGLLIQQFGVSGDTPVPSAFVP